MAQPQSISRAFVDDQVYATSTMLSAARSAVKSTQTKATFISLYSTISGLTRRNWRTGSHPAPKPLSKRITVTGPFSSPVEAEAAIEAELQGQSRNQPPTEPTPTEHAVHRAKIKKAFPEGWSPPRKLSREAMDGLRYMHAVNPTVFTTPMLAEKFKISPEAVRRILKSKWVPTHEQRVRFAARERKARNEWIEKRRAEEREKQRELQKAVEPVQRRVGKDRLTLT